jgi:hypothetical protein
VRTDTAIGDDDALDCRRPLGSFPALIPFKCLDFFYGLLGCRQRSDATSPSMHIDSANHGRLFGKIDAGTSGYAAARIPELKAPAFQILSDMV